MSNVRFLIPGLTIGRSEGSGHRVFSLGSYTKFLICGQTDEYKAYFTGGD
jgi:hypothetical protein